MVSCIVWYLHCLLANWKFSYQTKDLNEYTLLEAHWIYQLYCEVYTCMQPRSLLSSVYNLSVCITNTLTLLVQNAFSSWHSFTGCVLLTPVFFDPYFGWVSASLPSRLHSSPLHQLHVGSPPLLSSWYVIFQYLLFKIQTFSVLIERRIYYY